MDDRSMELADEAIKRLQELLARQPAPEGEPRAVAERVLDQRRLALALVELIDERIRVAVARGLSGYPGF